jgi:hypothetical protein
MGLEDIPPHFLIMHQFLYQAEHPLKTQTDVGMVGYTGKTREAQNKLRELGWRRADYNRESIDSDGNSIIRKQINRDSLWYRPEHWTKDEDVFPPVQPKTEPARSFEKKIRRGRRIMYPQDAKETIMDALVQYMSSGRVSQWYGGAGGHERMKNRSGRLDRPASVSLDFPADVDPAMLIPSSVFMSVVRKADFEHVDAAERGMRMFGWEQGNPNSREMAVWFNPKHWEPAVGDLGLLPTSDEAEAYQAQLPPDRAKTPTRRFLPDISLLADIELVAKMAIEAGKSSRTSPPASSGSVGAKRHTPGQTFKQTMSGEKGWVKDPSLDDIDKASVKKPPGKLELPGQAPARRIDKDTPTKFGPSSSLHPDDDVDIDDDDEDDEIDIPGEKLSAAELDKRAAARWEKEKEKMRKERGVSSQPSRMIFADDDDED